MLFRELTKSLGNKLFSSINVQKSDSILFGAPCDSPQPQTPPPLLIPCICEPEVSSSCSLCQGTHFIKQNDKFNAFLHSVIEFKLNRNSDASTESSSEDPHPCCKSALKEPCALKKEVTRSLQMPISEDQNWYLENFRLASSVPLVVHKGVGCDGCGANPIVGVRFQCNKCESYDLCGLCHPSNDHQHSFKRLEFSRNYLRKQTMKTHLEKERPRPRAN